MLVDGGCSVCVREKTRKETEKGKTVRDGLNIRGMRFQHEGHWLESPTEYIMIGKINKLCFSRFQSLLLMCH